MGLFPDGPVVSLLATIRRSVVSSGYKAPRILGADSVTHLHGNYKTSVKPPCSLPAALLTVSITHGWSTMLFHFTRLGKILQVYLSTISF
jgi:hypothetical protein